MNKMIVLGVEAAFAALIALPAPAQTSTGSGMTPAVGASGSFGGPATRSMRMDNAASGSAGMTASGPSMSRSKSKKTRPMKSGSMSSTSGSTAGQTGSTGGSPATSNGSTATNAGGGGSK